MRAAEQRSCIAGGGSCAAGEMSDAAEVLNVVTERLDLTEEGRRWRRRCWGATSGSRCTACAAASDTRQKSYCQYLFTASASGLREQASVMRARGGRGRPGSLLR